MPKSTKLGPNFNKNPIFYLKNEILMIKIVFNPENDSIY